MRDYMARLLGRDTSAGDEHARILADTGRLLRILSEQPQLDDDALVDQLVAAGVDRQRAWRLLTFVPLAFGRHLIESLGIETPPPTYLRRDARGRETKRNLRDEAEFRAASDHIADFAGHPGLEDATLRSPEVNAVNDLFNAGSEAKDVALGETVIDVG
jgi:hypothetical protein